MKRKVIQIANSTQLISLPRKWAIKYGIKKGDELNIEVKDGKLIISPNGVEILKSELDVSGLGIMIPRYIHALYKKGIDELKVTFKDPTDVTLVQKALGKEAVGFEITEQGEYYCIIKHVSGELEEFSSVLKRVFALLILMAEEGLKLIKNKEYINLKNIIYLEEANNRFTTTCRRLLNKEGYKEFSKTGPMYYIIEELENLADEYKFLYNYLYEKRDKNIKLSKRILGLYEEINKLLKTFYEHFYKFNKEKLVLIGKKRKKLVNELYNILDKASGADVVVAHHLLVILQKIFCLIGPHIIISI